MRLATPYCLPAIWPAPPSVKVVHSVRWGGVSVGPYQTWNLGGHVFDAPRAVACNRDLLRKRIVFKPQCENLPLQWLNQIHSTRIVGYALEGAAPEADGVLLSEQGQAAAVLTADCLPVVLCRLDASAAVIVHAGWRGLAQGILKKAMKDVLVAGACSAEPQNVIAWLGPCILPKRFEVGPEAREALRATIPNADSAFLPLKCGRWQGMLSRLAYLNLRNLGIGAIYGFGVTRPMPSLLAPDPFFSFRRASITGRIATVLTLGC